MEKLKNLYQKAGLATFALMSMLLSQPAISAGLPSVTIPGGGGDKGDMISNITALAKEGTKLIGLALGVVGFIAVANSAISTYSEVQQGKKTWAQFGAIVIVGSILIVTVIWLANSAMDIF